MGQQIRKQMLQGHVEADEAYVGGRRPGERNRGGAGETIVFGMQERGGCLAVEPVFDLKKSMLREAVLRNVEKGSTVSTDELMSYGLLG